MPGIFSSPFALLGRANPAGAVEDSVIYGYSFPETLCVLKDCLVALNTQHSGILSMSSVNVG
jgi:hypothetical protein